MTSEPQKDAAAVRVLPPVIPLMAILFGLGLNRLWPIRPGFDFPKPFRYWIGGVIVAGSFLVMLWSVRLFQRTGQDANPYTPTPEIVESGPFRLTRNPMYLLMVLICLGIAVMLMNVWILLLIPLVAWMLQRLAILPEEAYLERKFGQKYLEYKNRVRRWL